jgi:sirohydrochlorin ferrochelatase
MRGSKAIVKKYGVLVISHGSRNKEWVALVDDAVSQVSLPGEIPIFSSFLELVEGRLIQDGIDALERAGVTEMIVVPLFVSSGSTHIDEISYALGAISEPNIETELTPFRLSANVHMCEPVDDDPEIANILLEKLGDLIRQPEKEIVVLVGHGTNEPGFHEKWAEGLRSLAAKLKAAGRFFAADTAMLLPDQLHERVNRWRELHPECAVLIAPLFLSEGYFTKQVVPSRLKGLEYRYNGRTLLPHPLMARWMEKQIRRFLP